MHYSVYLTSDIEEALDHYIDTHASKRSSVIQKALAQFLKKEKGMSSPTSADEKLKALLRDPRNRPEEIFSHGAQTAIYQALKDDSW